MDKLEIYHHLPYPMKVLGASLHGYYLRWWRYGKDTEKLVEEALERDTWTEPQWRSWQEERLAYILHRAATKVPYYRDQWQKRRASGDKASWDYLENWPILEKETVRQYPEQFINDDKNPHKMYVDHTSGTTGTPLKIYLSRETIHQWYALYEARIRKWHGVSIQEPWLILGGQLVTPSNQDKPPYWVRNLALNQLYLSSIHIKNKNISDYVHEINKFAPTHWIVYPSSAAGLASFVLEKQLKVIPPKVIFTNAEPLLDYQRKIMEQAFQCPIRETYGMAEIAAAASECECGNLHLFPDVGILENLDFKTNLPVVEGQLGEFVCTGLLNQDMPFIRYRIGDSGKVSNQKQCKCGREMPILTQIEGRTDDMIITPDGKRIGRMDPIFKADINIKESQIIQEALDFIRVKVVPTDSFNNEDVQVIIQRVHHRLGESMRIEVELVDEIPRTKAGKFKAVISNLKQEK